MEKYLNQLLEDILAAHKPENEANYSENEGIEAHFEEVERYLSGDYDQILGNVVGLDKEQFPPVEMLTESQMKLLIEALNKMLFSYNISTDLPDGLPVNIAYSLVVSVLDRDIYIGNGDGHIGIEFCHYDPQKCPFGDEFCSCKDYNSGIDEIKKANQSDEDSLF